MRVIGVGVVAAGLLLRRVGSKIISARLPHCGEAVTKSTGKKYPLKSKIMKNLFVLLSLAFFAGCILPAYGAEGKTKKPKAKLRHVVAFKFKEGTSKDDIKKVEDAFRALKTKIPQVVSLEMGTNVSPEKHDKGFTHGFILAFKNVKDRDEYLVHPEHKAFGELVGKVLADVFVIDFWAEK